MPPGTETVPLVYETDELRRSVGDDWTRVLTEAYRWMVFARTLDRRMLGLQRQGRVGFYGPATGQEAVSIAAGLVSRPADWILPGLREQLVALVRGHPLVDYVHHLFANSLDPGRGRQMPCHPTARDVNYVSMSSVVGPQIAHAVGVAYAQRARKADGMTFAFFGDGGTSGSDFHAGMNLSAVWKAPVAFCLTNNQWAISMPVAKQTKVHPLSKKADAYGIPGVTVDGTDFVACYQALARARERALTGDGPSLTEFVLYRMTPHSSSDDPRRYQAETWAQEATAHDPLLRLETLLSHLGLLDDALRTRVTERSEREITEAIGAAESVGAPDPATLTADVFAASSGSHDGAD